jgi:hypothetical protein
VSRHYIADRRFDMISELQEVAEHDENLHLSTSPFTDGLPADLSHPRAVARPHRGPTQGHQGRWALPVEGGADAIIAQDIFKFQLMYIQKDSILKVQSPVLNGSDLQALFHLQKQSSHLWLESLFRKRRSL